MYALSIDRISPEIMPVGAITRYSLVIEPHQAVNQSPLILPFLIALLVMVGILVRPKLLVFGFSAFDKGNPTVWRRARVVQALVPHT